MGRSRPRFKCFTCSESSNASTTPPRRLVFYGHSQPWGEGLKPREVGSWPEDATRSCRVQP